MEKVARHVRNSVWQEADHCAQGGSCHQTYSNARDDTCALTQAEQDLLERTEMIMLRWMMRIKRVGKNRTEAITARTGVENILVFFSCSYKYRFLIHSAIGYSMYIMLPNVYTSMSLTIKIRGSLQQTCHQTNAPWTARRISSKRSVHCVHTATASWGKRSYLQG